ncbi:MAG: cell division FtsA domain-containing protein, partial [Verrucomicrobiales bacterium]
VTHIPHGKAEQLKKEEGDALADPSNSIGVIKVPDETGYPETQVQRQLLNDIIRGRMEETLHIVKDRLPPEVLSKIGSGVYLTGGASQMRGLGALAHEVFNLPVFYPQQPDVSGVQAYFKDPQYSTALGLIRYAQVLDEERPVGIGSKLGGFLRSLWPL